MRTPLFAFVLSMVALLAGCRREDFHTAVIHLPGLVEADKSRIVDAFTIRKPGQQPRCYDGVRPEEFKFDFAAKTLTLKYDSMKIAKTNLRMIIETAGMTVVFPSNTTSVAGYLDRKVADDLPAKK